MEFTSFGEKTFVITKEHICYICNALLTVNFHTITKLWNL